MGKHINIDCHIIILSCGPKGLVAKLKALEDLVMVAFLGLWVAPI